MAIALVQQNVANAASVSLNGVTAGNLIVVCHSETLSGESGTLSCSDGTSTLNSVAASTGDFVRVQIFYLLSANSGNRTYTVTGSGGFAYSTLVMEFSHTGSISMEDYSNNSGYETSSISSGNVQPTGYSVVVAVANDYIGNTMSNWQVNGVAADGYQSYNDLRSWAHMWYRVVSSSFDGAATATLSDVGYWAASAAVFRETGAYPFQVKRRLNVLLRMCLSIFNLIWRCFK